KRRNIMLRKMQLVCPALAIAATIAAQVPLFGQSDAFQALYYSREYGLAETIRLTEDKVPYNVLAQPVDPGFTSAVQIFRSASSILLYNKDAGAASVTQINSDGIISEVSKARLVPGWTHVVSHRGYLLFYDENTGRAMTGRYNFTTATIEPFPNLYSLGS